MRCTKHMLLFDWKKAIFVDIVGEMRSSRIGRIASIRFDTVEVRFFKYRPASTSVMSVSGPFEGRIANNVK